MLVVGCWVLAEEEHGLVDAVRRGVCNIALRQDGVQRTSTHTELELSGKLSRFHFFAHPLKGPSAITMPKPWIVSPTQTPYNVGKPAGIISHSGLPQLRNGMMGQGSGCGPVLTWHPHPISQRCVEHTPPPSQTPGIPADSRVEQSLVADALMRAAATFGIILRNVSMLGVGNLSELPPLRCLSMTTRKLGHAGIRRGQDTMGLDQVANSILGEHSMSLDCLEAPAAPKLR